MQKSLIKRECPYCSNCDSRHIISLSYDKIFPLNHTLKPAWFNKTTITSSYSLPIVRCNKCNFVYSQYALNVDLQHSFYHNAIDANLSKNKIYVKEKRSALLSIWNNLHGLSVTSHEKIKVLDFGAGWGDFLSIAKCHGIEVFGLEFDERKIEFANNHQIPCGNMDFIKKNAPFDVFICNQVIEHLENPRASLIELRKLLKNNAVGYISVPNFSDERIEQELAALRNGDFPTKSLCPIGHLNYFNPDNLRKMIFESGFREIVKQPKKSISSMLLKSIKKFAGEKIPLGTSLYVIAI